LLLRQTHHWSEMRGQGDKGQGLEVDIPKSGNAQGSIGMLLWLSRRRAHLNTSQSQTSITSPRMGNWTSRERNEAFEGEDTLKCRCLSTESLLQVAHSTPENLRNVGGGRLPPSSYTIVEVHLPGTQHDEEGHNLPAIPHTAFGLRTNGGVLEIDQQRPVSPNARLTSCTSCRPFRTRGVIIDSAMPITRSR